MQVKKIDANSTGLRFAIEASLGVLPVTPTWVQLEPNSYKSFGANDKKVARNPINAGRQQKFGVAVDRDVSAGYQEDLTYTNLQHFVEALLYASFRTKQDLAVAAVDAVNGYEPAAGGNAFHANDLVFGSGFANAANNGVHLVTGNPGASSVEFAGSVTEAGATNGKITRVGAVMPAGDVSMVVGGQYPALHSTTFDFTELGCIPGEWIFIGGDAANSAFANDVNNGYARVNSVASHILTLDKTQNVCAADNGAGVSLQLYVGRVVKNESDPSLQVRRTYTFERSLGAPDDANPAQQAEYVGGAGFNEYVVTFNTADKVTGEISVIGSKYYTRGAQDGLAPGNRPMLTDTVGLNTTGNLVRAALTPVGLQTDLFAYLSVGAITVNNGIKANKALGVFGGFDYTAGLFVVSATATAYFVNVAALDAVRNNTPVSFDIIMATLNRGIAFDIPLVSLGNTGLAVASDAAITAPLTMDAGDASAFLPGMPHTLMMTFFDYLPNAAMPVV